MNKQNNTKHILHKKNTIYDQQYINSNGKKFNLPKYC